MGKVVSRQVEVSRNVLLTMQGSGWLRQRFPALVHISGWWGLSVGKVEPIAAVPAITVFQETCPSSSQCL